MPLINCTECGTQISDKAATCVKCGAPVEKPKVKASNVSPAQAVVSIGFALLLFIWLGTDDEPAPSPAKETAEEKCAKDDLQCLGDKGAMAAGFRCPRVVEQLAIHSVRWTDGMLEAKFSRFRWKDKEAGTITYIGDRAEFQNGFGAFTPIIYECDLSADNETVIDVRAHEGRLPPH
jgi:hypothetical protein